MGSCGGNGEQTAGRLAAIASAEGRPCLCRGQVLLPMLLNVVFDPACQVSGATANSMLLAAGDYR